MWRLINSGPGTGSWNMAVDEAILEAVIRGEAPPTLRFYSWQPPAISLGHFQPAEKALRMQACQAKGLEVVRRPTGGRAILHDKEITFSIIAPLAVLGTEGVMDSYRYLARGIIAGLRRLGVAAELVDKSARNARCPSGVARHPGAGDELLPNGVTASPAACFAVKARCDLLALSACPERLVPSDLSRGKPREAEGGRREVEGMVVGRKIVGSAQVHRDGVVLQQNSLPFVIEADKWKEVFQGLARRSLPSPEQSRRGEGGMDGIGSEAVGLWDAAGRIVEFDEAALALTQGFEDAPGVDLSLAELAEAESERARELQARCLLAP